MTSTQPLHADRRAAKRERDGSGSDFVRLFLQWGDLARRAAFAFAHDRNEWASLQASQLRTEEALERRHAFAWGVISDALIAWEATLWHNPKANPHPLCTHCRRASAGLLEHLPLPANGGAR